MTPALERLAELVRQAEAKTRAKKLIAEAQQASEQFRTVEARARQATQRLREIRPVRLRELEQADGDEQQLRDLVRKLAQFKSSLDPGSDAENLIETAQAEIRRKREEARAALEGLGHEVDEVRRELRSAMDHYQQLRRELDRLQPQLAATFAAEDRLLWDAETLFPGGQLQALAREVEASLGAFGALVKMEQYAQLKIWIGRLRLYQASGEDGTGEETPAPLAQRVFHQLKGLSKQYEPGYIEAFRHDFTTDWITYVAEAQEQLLQATEAARRPKDRDKDKEREKENEQMRSERPPRDPDRPPGESRDDARPTAATVPVAAPPHPAAPASAVPPTSYDDLLSATQGLRALMIGGSVREDIRRTLLRLFDFDRIDWEPSGEVGPVHFDSIERRVRDQSVDLVLILKGLVGDHVAERLQPLCEQHGIPCLLVEHGPGAAQVGEALRRGLRRSA
jgi:hypothetical protein